jgi:hypothetical protein
MTGVVELIIVFHNRNNHRIAALKVFLASSEAFLQRRGLALLFLFALLYYGAYCNTALVLTGEGGSNALIASRILQGWRPMVDMFVGYNLLWFYPLAGLFQITGPHMLAMQIFFMCISTLTGMLGFYFVKKTTGQAWLAALAGGIMILMPGAIFRNYMGFIGTLASFALVFGYLISASTRLKQCLWMGFCGLSLGICFLIRIEPSMLISIVWIGLVIIYPIGIQGAFLDRLRIVFVGTMLALIAFTAVHAPFVVHAHQRGFGREFLNQYVQFFGLFQWELKKEIQKARSTILDCDHPNNTSMPITGIPLPTATLKVPSQESKSAARDGRRARPDFRELLMWKGAPFFTLSIYFPIVSAVSFGLVGGVLFFFGILRGHERSRFLGLLVLTTTSVALSLFPQYFFFRPDSVHLAEFMVPFYPAVAFAAFAGWWIYQNCKSYIVKFGGLMLPVLCGLQVIIAFNSLYGREGSGSIRSARGRTAMFHAPGGIDFRVKPADLHDWEGLRDILADSTREGDYVVTFPYVPLLNVMSERPSYQFKLYVDNATEGPSFSEKTILELQEKNPAVVVVNNRAINNSEFSRFQNWAAPVYNHLVHEYVLRGTFMENLEVFIRADRVEKPFP